MSLGGTPCCVAQRGGHSPTRNGRMYVRFFSLVLSRLRGRVGWLVAIVVFTGLHSIASCALSEKLMFGTAAGLSDDSS